MFECRVKYTLPVHDAGGVAGKTGTGFNAKNSSTLMKQLKALEITKPPLKMPAKKRDTKWVQPKLVAKIEYRDFAEEGYLRHSSFKGLSK